MPPYSENSFIRTQNGEVLYAYSTPKGAGGTTEDIIDISNTGLDDLLVKMMYNVDFTSIATSAGVSVSIDSFDIFLFNIKPVLNEYSGSDPWQFEFIVPAQSELQVTAHCHAGDTGAFRSAQLIAYPLKVPQ